MNENMIHVHSYYSLFDSPQSAKDICKRAKELGVQNITLTDHGTLLGIDDFMEAGEEFHVNTIPGVEAYTKNGQHFILIAKNYEGFLSISHAMGDAKPLPSRVNKTIVDDEILEKYFQNNPNVIATTACVQGPISSILLNNYYVQRDIDKHMKLVEKYRNDASSYLYASDQIKTLSTQLKHDQEEIKKTKKLCGAAAKRRIASARKKLSSERDARVALSEMETDFVMAEYQTQDYEEEIKEIKNTLTVLRKEKKETQNNFTKYQKATEKVENEKAKLKTSEQIMQEARERLLYLKGIFPSFYVELQYHGLEIEKITAPLLLQLADETNTPIIASNDAHITYREDAKARTILRFNYFQKAEETSQSDYELTMKSDQELAAALKEVIPEERAWEAIHNTSVLEECHVVFPKGEKHYPKVQGGENLDELIAASVDIKKSKGEWNGKYQNRLDTEMSVIRQMGFSDYFVIVQDFCNAARIMGVVPKEYRDQMPEDATRIKKWIKEKQFQDGVGVGPGRGSAAGSLVCYLLGITNLDPLKYGLLFERFLNPERVSMPDIDTDIAKSLRPHVLRYLRTRYGERAVCSIATVNTYGAKGAIRMAGRELASRNFGNQKEQIQNFNKKYTYPLSDAVEDGMTLIDNEKTLSGMIHSSETMEQIWENAKLIEGIPFATGMHAGGVIISDNQDVGDYVPLAAPSLNDGTWVAQCDMVRAEEKGLLKMDLLGLNTLDIITDCVQLISQTDGVHIDIDRLDFEPEIFSEIYAKGFTNSVFQFESFGMKDMLKRFKPTCFEDIILLVAAFRPGPMQYLDDIIEVKNGRKKLTYKHPALESILSSTYGAVIYQEQVMQIFQKLAGYSLGGADLVRRAMGKKKIEKLAEERKAFVSGDESRKIDGCAKRGIDAHLANELFDEIMEFARYAFNKSHAATYAFVSYQTAWLKYHYPVEFACAMLNNKEQKDFKPILNDCMRSGIPILPPDINRSFYSFTVQKDAIRYGFCGIKGVGKENQGFIEGICADRSQNGRYLSVSDFLIRTIVEPARTIPQKMIVLFLQSGLFDFLGQNRECLIETYGKNFRGKTKENLIAAIQSCRVPYSEVDPEYNTKMEVQNLGMSFGYIHEYHCPSNFLECAKAGERVSVCGYLNAFDKAQTRNGDPMLTVELQGSDGFITARIYNNLYSEALPFLQEHLYKIIKITGKVKGEGIINVQKMPEEAREDEKMVFIRFLSYDEQNKGRAMRPEICTMKEYPAREQTGAGSQSDVTCRVCILNWEDKNGTIHDVPIMWCLPTDVLDMYRKDNVPFADPDHDYYTPESDSLQARTQ